MNCSDLGWAWNRNVFCVSVHAGVLWLYAQLDPDVTAAASSLPQPEEPAGGGVELHQSYHSIHPGWRSPVWKTLLVSLFTQCTSCFSYWMCLKNSICISGVMVQITHGFRVPVSVRFGMCYVQRKKLQIQIRTSNQTTSKTTNKCKVI